MPNREFKWFILPIVGVIEIYRFVISPLFPSSCRFYPTCSAYSVEAFRKHGFFKGIKLTFLRLIRCHQGNPGGYDPVPD